jgi:hypothetical protein
MDDTDSVWKQKYGCNHFRSALGQSLLTLTEDLYPAFHFDVDPAMAFHFDADPDPAFQSDAVRRMRIRLLERVRIRHLIKSDENLQLLAKGLSTAPLWASLDSGWASVALLWASTVPSFSLYCGYGSGSESCFSHKNGPGFNFPK